MQECKTGVLPYNFSRKYTDMMTRQMAFYKLIYEALKHPKCTQ
jgi:hypothetical protein